MLNKIVLNYEVINEYLNTDDYTALGKYLNTRFKLDRTTDGAPLPYEFSLETINMLYKILSKITSEEIKEDHSEILKELFRSCRNYVINSQVQKYLASDDKFLNNVKSIIDLSSRVSQDVLKVLLQFLTNLVVSNEIAAVKVYNVFAFQLFTLLKENICVYGVSALLYNLSLFQTLSLDYNMYVCILKLYEADIPLEYVIFLIDKLITYDSFWNNYTKISVNERLVALGFIRHKQIKGEKLYLPELCLKTLIATFVNSGNIIFQTVSISESKEAYEISEVLQVISSLSSTEEYIECFKNDKDLLITCGVLLINIHNLGKETKNHFSAIQKLAEIREPNSNICEHPAFGFKAELIRIIGNLCWKNKIMQDLTREAELVPVMLDCCNMDARNPFILQWVILAVRNLCENNLENQDIIAALHQEGTVSTSTLEEMGLTLDSNGDSSIKIVPLDAIRNRK